MKILNLLDKAIYMLEGSSKAIDLFKQLMDLSHKITRAEHPSDENDVKEYYKIHDELVKQPKEAIARAYQVNTKIPPTTDTNIVAHYYDDAMQYIEKLGFNIKLPRKKATEENMEGRCWEGYKPVAGMKPYEKGSCEKAMATQSDLNEINEVIEMLDKAIQFYNPDQVRDEHGRWTSTGAGGASGAKTIAESSGSGIPDILDRYASGEGERMGSYDWSDSAKEVLGTVAKALKGTGIKIKKTYEDEDGGLLMKIYNGAKKIGEHYAEHGDDVLDGLKDALKKTKYKITTEIPGDSTVYEITKKK